ncbi:MAG: hypothetical protein IJF83_03720 [Methanobrevibacter sp.]|nr:hypothetical protein [Methanobrevibacter sp.]
MNEATYITGVVIANGVPDSDGDCLDKKDIKKIFTKYLDRATDVMHTRIKNEGVEVLANWITETDTQVNGKIVPAGSWMATFAVTNEELLSSIREGSISGLSLGSVSEDAMTKKYWFINKSIHYQDLDDMEEVIPLFISFVDKGANQYGLEIMDYNVYINKNDKTGDKMTNEEEIVTNEEPMIPISALDKLREFFSFTKADVEVEEKTPEVNKQETDVEEPVNDDISNKELLEKLPAALAESVKDAISEAISNASADEDIDKSEKNDEEEKDEDSDEEKDEENVDESKKDEKEKEDVEINKRQTSMTDVIVNDAPSTDFYTRTKRDHLGRKIRR